MGKVSVVISLAGTQSLNNVLSTSMQFYVACCIIVDTKYFRRYASSIWTGIIYENIYTPLSQRQYTRKDCKESKNTNALLRHFGNINDAHIHGARRMHTHTRARAHTHTHTHICCKLLFTMHRFSLTLVLRFCRSVCSLVV